jgi:hypothetical protein
MLFFQTLFVQNLPPFYHGQRKTAAAENLIESGRDFGYLNIENKCK